MEKSLWKKVPEKKALKKRPWKKSPWKKVPGKKVPGKKTLEKSPRKIDPLRGGKGSSVLVSQSRVLLDLLDEADQSLPV